ncbi:M24 family metallopeptidase [Nocardiopsis ansamitocini]|uniref:Peptidase n=1 Tax=Nocardiopsis ansamitocini TaxID=1670832 RepID=A0A9W6P8T8_9ACTN|nr:Xaa-Pro peptidase family protein [Nocardiopsis ansamitocini]GLU49093.1 peptidase [Nocardiopsis ansamitocini]
MDLAALETFLARHREQNQPAPAIPFTPEEYDRRLTALRAAMAKDGIDLLLLSSPEAMYWLHGFASRWYKAHAPRQWRPLICTAVHVDHDRHISFDGAEHAELFRRTSIATDVRFLPRDQRDGMLGFIVEELRAEGWLGTTAGLEKYSYLPNPAVSAQLQEALEAQGCTVVDGTDAVRRVRRRKSAAELACVERAAEICDIGLTHLASVLRPGMTELEAWSEMVHAMSAAGGEPAAIHEMAVVGPRAGHAIAGRRVLKEGDIVNVDPCGVYNRYHSNRTGTLCLGEPPRELVQLMEILAGAFPVLCATAKAGTPVREVNRALREYYDSQGLWRLRDQIWIGGYELGVSFPPDWVGDWIFTVNDDDTEEVFEEGMVTNYESMLYLGLIDTLIYEPSGARTLSALPHEITAVDC